MPLQARDILDKITSTVLNKTTNLELYNLYYVDEQKQKRLMLEILQDMTVEWAAQVSFEDFSMFVDRYVHNFLTIKSQEFKKVHAEALQNVKSINGRTLIVSHLFKDTDVNWFITIPREK
jgi:hypothetical protein